jgi:hypothetical protein
MPALHLADLALTAARRTDDDPSPQARRLYDRPDAPPLPDPAETKRSLVAALPLGRLAVAFDALRARMRHASEQAAIEREAEAT